jgi:hypothetical protein
METRLRFSFPGKPIRPWTDGQLLVGVDDSDIRQLILECEVACALLKYELHRQTNQQAVLHQCNTLLEKAKAPLLWHIELSMTSLMGKLREPLSNKVNRDDEIVWLISKLVSPAHALLLSCPPAVHIRNLTMPQKAKLVQFISEHRSELLHLDLVRLANEHCISVPRKAVLPVQTELRRVFDGLQSDPKDLARIIVFAGGSVSESLLWGACRPRTWGPNGEIKEATTDLIGVLTNIERCEEASRHLAKHHIIIKHRDMDQLMFSVHPALRQYIRETANSARWELEATKAVLYAFPNEGYLDPML